MAKSIFLLAVCHLIGDYCLQNDFLARTKGQNWYHLFAHCALYVVPFYVVFGWCWQLGAVFVSHMIVEDGHALLRKYAGIEARPYTAYQYYDEDGTFIGCSDESCLDDLLEKANVEVRDG